ncbi:hypothetical protein [Scopulibacillus darangshiensis]|uniref:hypothetical protein n=1 Tax=Scopulibacillus darangshiensis TaxID=442528 RepID=UPI00104C31F9|nr:hypothetical protein [Scopulibacillus darangshiensis]
MVCCSYKLDFKGIQTALAASSVSANLLRWMWLYICYLPEKWIMGNIICPLLKWVVGLFSDDVKRNRKG